MSHSNIRRDPRLVRQIKWLKQSGATSITTIGWGHKPDEVDDHYVVPVLPLLKRYFGYAIRHHSSRFNYFYGRYLDSVPSEVFLGVDLLIVNEIEYLGWSYFRNVDLVSVPTYIDLHEDHVKPAHRGPLERIAFLEYWKWQLENLKNFSQERQGLLRVTCVEKNIAESYATFLSHPVDLIFNAPDENFLVPSAVNDNQIRLVHHGMGTKGRGIEQAVSAMKLLDARFTLDLVLFATPQFRLKIELMSRILRVRKRITISPGVPLSELPEVLNQFDVAIVLAPATGIPTHFNALPNKFFESIHAKLALVVGPNPSMSELVRKHGNGFVLESWETTALVQKLSSISVGEIELAKGNSATASKSLSSAASKETFDRAMSYLLSKIT